MMIRLPRQWNPNRIQHQEETQPLRQQQSRPQVLGLLKWSHFLIGVITTVPRDGKIATQVAEGLLPHEIAMAAEADTTTLSIDIAAGLHAIANRDEVRPQHAPHGEAEAEVGEVSHVLGQGPLGRCGHPAKMEGKVAQKRGRWEPQRSLADTSAWNHSIHIRRSASRKRTVLIETSKALSLIYFNTLIIRRGRREIMKSTISLYLRGVLKSRSDLVKRLSIRKSTRQWK